MYIFTLVTDVRKAVEELRSQFGDFKLAMLYNSALDASSNWNLIISSDWTDRMGIAQATKVIAKQLYDFLDLEKRPAIARVTVLKTTDAFVRDMTQLYPVLNGGVPLQRITAGGITEGAGFVFYSQPEIAV
jgi:hypothetical protein